MEENLDHEQSLSLINEMISRARNNVTTKGAYSLIYWGYITSLLAIINSVLMNTLSNPSQSFLIWSLILPATVGSVFIERRNNRKNLVKTHIDKIGAMVWLGFLISFFVFTFVLHTISIKFEITQIFIANTPVIMIMVGMGHFITACVFRQKKWFAIAAFTWCCAILCAFLNVDMQFLVFAACMIGGLVIPGHILYSKAKKSHV